MKPLALLLLAFCVGLASCDAFTAPELECRETGSGIAWIYNPATNTYIPVTYTTSWCASGAAWMCYAMLDAPGADSVRVMWQRPYPQAPYCRVILGIRQ